MKVYKLKGGEKGGDDITQFPVEGAHWRRRSVAPGLKVVEQRALLTSDLME
jgi:hypothetical protein